MALVRKRLQDRRIEREQSQVWYESFNWSPWLATLVSAPIRPLILLMLALTSGPCIINALHKFVKEWISTVQLMTLKQYQPTETSQGIKEMAHHWKTMRDGGDETDWSKGSELSQLIVRLQLQIELLFYTFPPSHYCTWLKIELKRLGWFHDRLQIGS